MTSRSATRFFVLLFLVVLGCSGEDSNAKASTASGAAAGAGDGDGLRLVVLCSVDQLASWVWEGGREHFAEDGGFRRLLSQGVHFSQCAYEHACTETGPGHATIGTGAPAAQHGIVRNNWWSPPDGKKVYCVGHPAGALPSLLAGKDRGPDRLIAETLSEVMRRELPGSKVASVSWKDRSAILMVGKHADVAAWMEEEHGELVTNSTWCDVVPRWIEQFNERHAIDDFHGTQWERFGPDAAYEGLVDDRPYEQPHLDGSNRHTLPTLLTGGKDEPDKVYYHQIYDSPMGNEVVRMAAEACVEGEGLGTDAVPDLLAVSFSSTDTVGHHFGADSVEARDALLRLDRQLGRFLDFLDRKVGAGRYAFFLTADHGVGPTPEQAKAEGLDAGRGLIQSNARAIAERDIMKQMGKAAAGTRYVAYVGEWALVFDKKAFERGDGAAAAKQRFQQACAIAAQSVPNVQGITAAYTTRDILDHEAGDDPYRLAFKKALHPARAGDVQFVVQKYWLDGVVPASHGTPHPYDREVVGFAMGPGIARGVEIEQPVTPGLGVVLFATMLGVPKPRMAVDKLPADLLVAQ